MSNEHVIASGFSTMACTADPIFPMGKLRDRYAKDVAANFDAVAAFSVKGIPIAMPLEERNKIITALQRGTMIFAFDTSVRINLLVVMIYLSTAHLQQHH